MRGELDAVTKGEYTFCARRTWLQLKANERNVVLNNSVAQSQDVQQHQYLTLLDLSKALTLHRSLSDLLHDLAGRLTNLFDFNYLSVILHDGQQNVMRLHMIETTEPTLRELPTEINIEGSIAGWVWQNQ